MRRITIKMLPFLPEILNGSGRCCRNGYANEVSQNEVNLRRLFVIWRQFFGANGNSSPPLPSFQKHQFAKMTIVSPYCAITSFTFR